MGVRTPGRRRPDLVLGELPPDLRAGDYWKVLDKDGSERRSTNPENLTGTCWFVCVPMPGDSEGYGLGRLEHHTVREHDDGTISVRPNDGSSNSILVSGGPRGRWHGYIDHGTLEEADG
ncbi:MAG: hypothetical protein ACJ79H_17515 [Myxococcales bacterium]